MKVISFETERLVIRPTQEEDAAFIFQLLNSPKWLKNIGNRNISSEIEAKHYIQTKMIAQRHRLGYSNNTIIRKSDQVKIGTCGIYNREGLNGVDLGFALLPQFESMGYAYESCSKLLDVAKLNFDIKELNAITLKENLESQQLLTKLGFTYVKVIQLPNDTEELMLFQTTL